MTRCDISPVLLSTMMFLMHLRSVTLNFGVKSVMDIRSDLVRNVWRIKPFFIHENMKSMKTWEYIALLPWNPLPEMYLNSPNLDGLSVGGRTCLSLNPNSRPNQGLKLRFTLGFALISAPVRFCAMWRRHRIEQAPWIQKSTGMTFGFAGVRLGFKGFRVRV